MKIKMLTGALLLGVGVAHAQTSRNIDYVPSTSLQTSINNLFSQINTNDITSGMLMNKTLIVQDPSGFDGTSTCDTATSNHWYTLYAQSRAARIASSPTMPDDSVLFENIASQNAEDRISVGILFLNYHTIKDASNATEGWFTYSNNQLHDANGRTENPYEQKLLLVTAPVRKSNIDEKVKFYIPSSLSFTNRGSYTLQADWGDGQGYKSVSYDTEYEIIYTTAGHKYITLKFTQGGLDYYAKTTLNIENVFGNNHPLGKNCIGICFDDLWTDIDYTTAEPITTAEAYVIYANGRNHLRHPIIFVEGQDVMDEYNFRELFVFFSGTTTD